MLMRTVGERVVGWIGDELDEGVLYSLNMLTSLK